MSSAVHPISASFAPTESQLAVAYSVCRGIARASAKNFYYAFLVLPKSKRQALCAVYAFMRRCDDIADDPSFSLRERQDKLNAWLASLHRAQTGEPTDDPILLALTDAQRRFSIPAHLLDQLAYGTAMDVEGETSGQAATVPQASYQTFADLCFYCYRVASVVGLVCIRVFGYRDHAAEKLAERLGLAFQLTNIIRDVKEDFSLGRVYLPQEDLAKFDLSPGDLQADSPRLRQLLAAEADRAREFYRAGDELLHLIDEDSQPALWVLMTIYRRLLEKIARLQYDVFSRRIGLTTREKIVVLGRGWLRRMF
jgi:15-cis-phytoene synthase